MAERTQIPWCYHTMNWWIGCTRVSEACENCYAEEQEDHRFHRAQWGDHPRYRTSPSKWREPFAWDRKAREAGEQRRVFTNSLSDFFDNQVPAEWRTEAWENIRRCDHLDWLILTKRPQNIRKMLPPDWGQGWSHVWLGCTVENMVEARRRIPVLLRVPAICHFLSCEPLLAALDLRPWLGPDRINWIICGGESGSKNRRMMDPDWARDLRDQSKVAGVAFFMKQMTCRFPKQGEALIPSDLMVRQFPDLDE
jgi:protein gp37